MSKEISVRAEGVDHILSAQAAISRNKEFIKKLCDGTPWQPPFTVNGGTPRHGNLVIKKDFSNFSEMSDLALSDDKDDGFRNVGRKDCQDLLPTSYGSYGFSFRYTDAYKIRRLGERSSLRVRSPSYIDGSAELRWLMLTIPAAQSGGVNEGWTRPEVINRVISIFLSEFVSCASLRFTTSQLIDSSKTGRLDAGPEAVLIDVPDIAPITYFGNPKVIDVLRDEPDIHPYGDGLLLRLTDDIAGAERMEIVERLHAISQKLFKAGITNLAQGINRADWGCDSSSVLQGEPEIWPENQRD